MGWGLPKYSVLYARVRGVLSRSKLPPGKLIELDRVEKQDRDFLIHHAASVGPVFKAVAWDEFWICLIGLPLGRRLLREHGADLKPVTLQLEPLFPKGFLRQMQGDDHRHYRQALVRAIKPADLSAGVSGLEEIVRMGLAEYVEGSGDDATSAEVYTATLNTIASGMLIQLFFGAEIGSARFERIMEGYRKLGPYGLVWNIGEKQKEAFGEIRDFLLAQASDRDGAQGGESADCILGRIAGEGVLDATILGNLIYMVEMGRYDTFSLFRWLTKYAAENPQLLEDIAREDHAGRRDEGSLAEAFVLETLRMDQSERLVRKAQRDIVFEGYLIPKHATVRICLWESHKAAEAFPSPFRFDPSRFLEEGPNSDQFSPFGLDHHRCPFGDIAIKTSIIFIRMLARDHTVAAIADGLPVRGAYHWEPASKFGVKLMPRTERPPLPENKTV